jgi:hypothetical protein
LTIGAKPPTAAFRTGGFFFFGGIVEAVVKVELPALSKTDAADGVLGVSFLFKSFNFAINFSLIALTSRAASVNFLETLVNLFTCLFSILEIQYESILVNLFSASWYTEAVDPQVLFKDITFFLSVLCVSEISLLNLFAISFKSSTARACNLKKVWTLPGSEVWVDVFS